MNCLACSTLVAAEQPHQICSACAATPEVTTAKLRNRATELARTATPEQIARATLIGQHGKCWRCSEPLEIENGAMLAVPPLAVVVCGSCLADTEGTDAALATALAGRADERN